MDPEVVVDSSPVDAGSQPQSDLDILNGPDPEVVASPNEPVVPETPEVGAEPVTPVVPVAVAPEPEEEEFPSTIEAPTIKSLNEKLAKNPAFAAAVSADPALKNLLFSSVRQAAAYKELKGVVPTVEAARTAMTLAQNQSQFNQHFNNPQGGQAALEHIAWQRTPDGKIAAGPDGQPILSEGYQRLVGAYRQQLYDYVAGSGDPKALEAVQLIAQLFGDKSSFSTVQPSGQPDPNAPAVSPEVKARLDLADRYEKEETTRQQHAVQQYNESVNTGITDAINSDIDKVLGTMKNAANLAITPYLEGVLKSNVLSDIRKVAGENAAYQQHIEMLYNNSPKGPEGLKSLIQAARQFTKDHITSLVRKHLDEVSQPILQAQSEKGSKVQAQVNKPNVRSAGGAAAPSRPDAQTRINEFRKANGGRAPSDLDILNFD